ncbi:hypothetical protein LPJ75_000155 [Coemansia sp. RSA 2598]|nr:hypothetical protein LPJ75_000155 [Coemansia sp. RSA 2598]
MWTGTRFSPVFSRQIQPALAVTFVTVGLVYAGKFLVTQKDINKEAMYAVISSAALGLGAVLGIQALGLYL